VYQIGKIEMIRRILSVLLLMGSLHGTTALAADDAMLARGTYLMDSIVACGNCHTPRDPENPASTIAGMAYAGAFTIKEEGLNAYASNITMDIETGIGSWTDEGIITAIRDGIRPDGTLIGPPMPSPFYATMSDYDVQSIVAYLRTVEPVNNVVPKSEYSMPLPPNYGPKVESVPEVSKDDLLAYGRYVTHTLGHCTECHTPMSEGRFDFSRLNVGGRVLPNVFGVATAVSLNITPHPTAGIGEWSDEEIKRAITDGVSRDGRELVEIMAYPSYKNINEEDMNAMIAYLRSVPPLSGLE
jgi:mono/diheme cytochrome c family protein